MTPSDTQTTPSGPALDDGTKAILAELRYLRSDLEKCAEAMIREQRLLRFRVEEQTTLLYRIRRRVPRGTKIVLTVFVAIWLFVISMLLLELISSFHVLLPSSARP